MTQQESSRCAICSRLIDSEEERRFIQSAGSTLSVHGICLMRLRRLACEADGRTPSLPTLTRSLTLNEFLLTRHPQTGADIFSCVAYYVQVKTKEEEHLTLDRIQHLLQYSAYKIPKLEEVAGKAVTLGLVELHKLRGATHYIITAKGREVVERLPPIPE